MAIASNLGFPRIGAQRELKKALEGYWAGKIAESSLLATGQSLRRRHWELQQQLGLTHIPSNDFSFYDHVLDAAVMVGAVPSRYKVAGEKFDLRAYFAMARGLQMHSGGETKIDLPAMEMTKWFDTNYHYIVPEFETTQRFHPVSCKPVEEFQEAKKLGIHTRPVLLGPVSFLLLGKARDTGVRPLTHLDELLPVYADVLRQLAASGADWIQMDEPCLVLDLSPQERAAFTAAYSYIDRSTSLKVLLATYFGGLRENLHDILRLPVSALHLDLVRAPEQLAVALSAARTDLMLSLGVIDGRNVWRTDLNRALAFLEEAANKIGADRLMIAPSCSLLHSPVDLDSESGLPNGLQQWLAFAKQKLEEVIVLAQAIGKGRAAVQEALSANREAMENRRQSPLINDQRVKARVSHITPEMLRRKSAYPIRHQLQKTRLHLPLLPTTTIGSFPQTPEVRAARAEFKTGKKSSSDYQAFLKQETENAIRLQEKLGLDVLVHGEFERNDMVEYFGEQLSGFAATQNGWIQSYGSRCVKPPIIYGDVARIRPMTVEWARFAQSLTQKPVKGMLTGPVTILQWSLVRDDQPREETCRQIALAIRDEVCDLEKEGISIIQIDEPAIREGLPLRRADWKSYLEWAVTAFRLASSGVRDETQIHTHMCYSEFNDIIESIGDMDADVISMETSRSQMELLSVFARYRYPNEIGPGVYDIHSPRIPATDEIEALLGKALTMLRAGQLWVNPDCGLKTRRWDEVTPALAEMVAAARNLRRLLAKASSDEHPCEVRP